MKPHTATEEDDFADVSVVIPCYKCGSTLSRAIESVLAQTILPRELILVDDYSCDETLMLLKVWQEKKPQWIRLVVLPTNLGAGSARNSGWEIAKGKFIAWLDADDSWHPEKLAIQYGYMDSHPEVSLSGHGHAVNQYPNFSEISQERLFSKVATWWLLMKNPFVTPSVMVRADICKRFPHGQRYMEDHLLWMELALSGYRVEKLNTPLVLLHKEQVGVSGLSNHVRAMSKADFINYWQLYKKGLLGFLGLMFCWAWGVVKFLRRSILFGVPRVFKRTLLRLGGQP